MSEHPLRQELGVRFRAATAVVDECFEELKAYLRKDFADLESPSYVHLVIHYLPGVETVLTPNGTVYYVVDDALAAYLSGAAQDLPDAAEIIREICASNIMEGQPLPYNLRCAAFSMIKGSFPAATRRGRRVDGQFCQRWLFREAAIYVRDAFDLHLTRNEASGEMSACDAVSQVAARHRVDVPFERLRDWCTHKSHREFRVRADSLSNVIRDLSLIELGALRSRGPFGPIAELARMRS